MSDNIELQKIVGQVAAAYFSNSHVSPAEIPTVITQIANSLGGVGEPPAEPAVEAPQQPKLTPAQIRKSITPEALISFEDNKPYKTLRRHLAVRGLTPDEYRAKWGLSKDYPMVAPSYSEARSNLAKALGLGSRVNAQPAAAEPAKTAEEPAKAAAAAGPAPKRQTKGRGAVGRPRKAKPSAPPAG